MPDPKEMTPVAKLGRPPKSKADRATAMIHVRFTEDEFDQIAHAAGLADMTVSLYIRSAIVEIAEFEIEQAKEIAHAE